MPKPVHRVKQFTPPSKSLELPDGYQRFDWYEPKEVNPHGVVLNDPLGLKQALQSASKNDLYLYTQHEIFYEEGLLKHTRTSPNWEGGMVTYSTCKHNMRCYGRDTWEGVWIAGLCPAHCEQNCLLFVGQVWKQFPSNYTLGGCLLRSYPSIWQYKQANNNPRGDLYLPKKPLVGDAVFDHQNFIEPKNHTRSVDLYKKSPGSISTRSDGKVPKQIAC